MDQQYKEKHLFDVKAHEQIQQNSLTCFAAVALPQIWLLLGLAKGNPSLAPQSHSLISLKIYSIIPPEQVCDHLNLLYSGITIFFLKKLWQAFGV